MSMLTSCVRRSTATNFRMNCVRNTKSTMISYIYFICIRVCCIGCFISKMAFHCIFLVEFKSVSIWCLISKMIFAAVRSSNMIESWWNSQKHTNQSAKLLTQLNWILQLSAKNEKKTEWTRTFIKFMKLIEQTKCTSYTIKKIELVSNFKWWLILAAYAQSQEKAQPHNSSPFFQCVSCSLLLFKPHVILFHLSRNEIYFSYRSV